MHRLGHGRLKHIETRYLFMQSLIHGKKLAVQEVVGTQDSGDIGTNALSSSMLTYFMPKAGIGSSSAFQAAIVCVLPLRRLREGAAPHVCRRRGIILAAM